MYNHQDAARPGRRTDLPVSEGELDADLVRSVRRASWMRQGFYLVVLIVAMAGQVTGAVESLHIPLVAAIPAVGALELGGIVVMANADVRRRLGERATVSRLLSAVIAAWAVAFNWLAHADHLRGGFYAGMSALGYLVWLMHTENQRRDRLRAKGDLPPTTPAYEVFGHWLRHPWLTLRARSLAKANPHLGLYDSIEAARADIRRERRTSAISKVLHRKIRASVDPTTADIAVAAYDLDQIAGRLADNADYDGLTALIAADLAPARIALDQPAHGRRHAITIDATPALTARPAGPTEAGAAVPTKAEAEAEAEAVVPVKDPTAASAAAATAGQGDTVTAELVEEPARPVLAPELRRGIEDAFGVTRQPFPAAGMDAGAPPAVPSAVEPAAERAVEPAAVPATGSTLESTEPAPQPEPARPANGKEPSLRKRVHDALNAYVPAGDKRDTTQLLDLVGDVLRLNNVERLTAASYVRSWRRDVNGRQPQAARQS